MKKMTRATTRKPKQLVKKSKLASSMTPLIVAGSLVLLAGLAYAMSRKAVPANISVVDEVANNCSYSFSINKPAPSPLPSPSIPSSPNPSPSAVASSICKVEFELPDTSVCWKEPRREVLKYRVVSLPPGGPYYMQTDWYIASPVFDRNRYDESQLIEAGKTYSLTIDWPGVTAENISKKQTVETHAGIQVVDKNHNLLTPNCTDGMDYYWTPWVCSL